MIYPAGLEARSPFAAETSTVLTHYLLWLMFGIKFLVVLFVLTLWQSGGFTAAQFVATLTLLPIFATYTTVMFRNSVRERHVQQYATTVLEPRVSRSFQFTAYGLFLLYGFTLFFVIGLRGRGILGQFDHMTSLLALVELLLGVYVGQVVFSLFKRE